MGEEILCAELQHFALQFVEVVVLTINMVGEGANAVDKSPGEFLLGMVEDLFGRTFFVDAAFVHVEHTGADVSGKRHFVGDDSHGHALLGEIFDNAEHFAHHGGVEGGGGFVEKDDFGVHGEATGYGHALLLSAGELRGHGVGLAGEADHFEEFHGTLFGLFARLV